MIHAGESAFGFAFDPFEQVDSAKDAHLPEYLVAPASAQSVLTDQPIAVFARPGGGKSALRIYAFNFYKDSRGLRFPLVYVPDTFDSREEFHFKNLLAAAARSVLMYLISYPDIFFVLSPAQKETVRRILLNLPFHQDALFIYLRQMKQVAEAESLLGAAAMSGGKQMETSHYKMFSEIQNLPVPSSPAALDETFAALAGVFGSKSVHVLVDGLDGFTETETAKGLLDWIAPLLEKAEEWRESNVYLKFFLPMNVSDAPRLADSQTLRAIPLEWDDNLLAQVIRRRVFVASGGRFDSLDAVAAPDVRGAELILARQLPDDKKLPRLMVLQCARLTQIAKEENLQEIALEHLSLSKEALYAN